MNKILMGTIPCGIIIFTWNILSAFLLPIHHHTYKSHPYEDEILKQLQALKTLDGAYFLPSLEGRTEITSGDNANEIRGLDQQNLGGPSVILIYKYYIEPKDIGYYFFEILYDLFIAFVLCFTLSSSRVHSRFADRFLVCLIIALGFICAGPLTWVNRDGYPISIFLPSIFDTFISVGLAGAFASRLFRRH